MNRGSYGNLIAPVIIALLLIMLPQVVAASGDISSDEYSDFYMQSLSLKNNGMMVLGGWAVANIATGAYGWSKTTGEWERFHQMNLFWNLVNLSIAGIAIYSNINNETAGLTAEEMMREHMRTERILLINAGLDVLYMGGGFLMRHLSHGSKHSDLLKGYGNSVIMQGAFLFLFDLVLYGVLSSHRTQFLTQIEPIVSPEMAGLSLTIPF